VAESHITQKALVAELLRRKWVPLQHHNARVRVWETPRGLHILVPEHAESYPAKVLDLLLETVEGAAADQ